MGDTTYSNAYRNIDFRQHPEKYLIGRGEQGVLIAEPYKSEILPYWKFATTEAARMSAKKIYQLFVEYGKQQDFVGMDMARKYLQMGFTRARRYANHPSGQKYTAKGDVAKQDKHWAVSVKAQSANIFYDYYAKAKNNKKYLQLKTRHLATQEHSK